MRHTVGQLCRTNTFKGPPSTDEDSSSKRPQWMKQVSIPTTVPPPPPQRQDQELQLQVSEINQINKAFSSSTWEVQIPQTLFQTASHPDCGKINGLFTGEQEVGRRRKNGGETMSRHLLVSGSLYRC